MLTGRSDEIHYLNQFYERMGSQIIVVYGQKGVGKTRLIREFTEDKPNFFYACRDSSEREQRYQWGRELYALGHEIEVFPKWHEIFAACLRELPGKAVLVLDEFQFIVKNSGSFTKELISFVNSDIGREFFVILISSSASWVENSMVKKMGEAALGLSALLKIRPLDFFKLRRAFPGYSVEDAMYLYAVLGGFPGLWQYMSPEKSLKENICENIVASSGPLHEECRRLLSEELRELNVYHTILSALAGGFHKLNDISIYTGFSRAKISVYLKNLMELELIEKVFSYDTEGRENAQKGIYRICNHFVHFYFTCLYPNKSSLSMERAEDFYLDYIYPVFRQYVSSCFREICRMYLLREDAEGRLPFKVSSYGEWVGKSGDIDIILQGKEKETLISCCNWERPLMSYEEYEDLKELAFQARLEPEYIWLFSGGRFDEKLYLEAKLKGNVRLISLKDMV